MQVSSSRRMAAVCPKSLGDEGGMPVLEEHQLEINGPLAQITQLAFTSIMIDDQISEHFIER